MHLRAAIGLANWSFAIWQAVFRPEAGHALPGATHPQPLKRGAAHLRPTRKAIALELFSALLHSALTAEQRQAGTWRLPRITPQGTRDIHGERHYAACVRYFEASAGLLSSASAIVSSGFATGVWRITGPRQSPAHAGPQPGERQWARAQTAPLAHAEQDGCIRVSTTLARHGGRL